MVKLPFDLGKTGRVCGLLQRFRLIAPYLDVLKADGAKSVAGLGNTASGPVKRRDT